MLYVLQLIYISAFVWYFQAIDTALHVATQEVDKLFLGSASRTIYLQIYETQIFYVIVNYLLLEQQCMLLYTKDSLHWS